MMTDKSQGIREGLHTVSPYMIIKDAASAIAFYKKAFGAAELMRVTGDNGKIRHAEIQIGDSRILIVDEFPEFPLIKSPQTLKGSPVHIFLFVEDADRFFGQAVEAGAEEVEPLHNHTEGNRHRRGGVRDPFGHIWWIASHIKDV